MLGWEIIFRSDIEIFQWCVAQGEVGEVENNRAAHLKIKESGSFDKLEIEGWSPKREVENTPALNEIFK